VLAGRATVAAPFVAAIVLLLCLFGLASSLKFFATSDHAIGSREVLGVLILVWGAASAAGVLARRPWAHWAHWSFGLWAIITGLASLLSYFGWLVFAALLLARWAVGSEPRSAPASCSE